MGRRNDVPLRLLVVDDDSSYADMTAEWLSMEGLEVETVGSGRDVLAILEADGGFDCVVSDYDMPEMDGLALLRAVRERDMDVPFVMHTGHGNEALASEAIAAGVDDYVPKGFSRAHFVTLGARIRLAVDRVRTERRFRAMFTQGFDAMLVADDDGDEARETLASDLVELEERLATLAALADDSASEDGGTANLETGTAG